MTKDNLAVLPFTSNTKNYKNKDQGFERISQGLPAERPDMGAYLTTWDAGYRQASQAGQGGR